ncbi:unnamed protein product [Rangifer tarandus platyrhynchus]|uniref:Uncharacterized protein n=1 Tax=Rangifer tarandus platyrhynchus TaxID=3082113 RepID=A0AC59ZK40_RANTA
MNAGKPQAPGMLTADVHFRDKSVTRRPALFHPLFPVAEAGEDAQVGSLGKENRLASCGTGAHRGRGLGAEVFLRKTNLVQGARSTAG